ncbi:MAG TPA: PadR family transcriptional regulator [Steroidobacteraceae bacterium]|nr:PadR family transcriptional regulator [Steroidobacteraceae bacterium]
MTVEGIDTGADAGLEPAEKKFQRELNAGLIGLVLLSVLDRANEDLYGYQIAKQLQSVAPGLSVFKQGALYPVLRNMSAGGLLASRVVPSYAGPPRRYYRITDQGRVVLKQWLGIWEQTRDFVDLFTQPGPSTRRTD